MSKCRECKGRGRWQAMTIPKASIQVGTKISSDEFQWFECNTCQGTGIEQDPELGDDYDIGGDSYADDN